MATIPQNTAFADGAVTAVRAVRVGGAGADVAAREIGVVSVDWRTSPTRDLTPQVLYTALPPLKCSFFVWFAAVKLMKKCTDGVYRFENRSVHKMTDFLSLKVGPCDFHHHHS